MYVAQVYTVCHLRKPHVKLVAEVEEKKRYLGREYRIYRKLRDLSRIADVYFFGEADGFYGLVFRHTVSFGTHYAKRLPGGDARCVIK